MGSIFAGIEEVNVKQRSRYVAAGNYEGEVQAIKYGRTNQDDRPYFVCEVKVLKSDNPDFKEGSVMTWMTMVHKYKHYFLEEVKGFVAAVTDSTADEVTEEVVEFVTGEDQPLAGTRVGVHAWDETNGNTGKAYTRTEFRLLSE